MDLEANGKGGGFEKNGRDKKQGVPKLVETVKNNRR